MHQLKIVDDLLTLRNTNAHSLNTKAKFRQSVNERSCNVTFALWCHLTAKIEFRPLLINRKSLITFKQFEKEGRYKLNTSSKPGSRNRAETSLPVCHVP